MNRPTPRAPTRTLAQHEDTQDLVSVISAALAARPVVDESMLRRGVWTYVGEERHAGTSPGCIILALTEMIERSKGMSTMEQHAVMRRVILWCVEAYFGHLGGQLGEHRTAN
jgi:hypothetical protein